MNTNDHSTHDGQTHEATQRAEPNDAYPPVTSEGAPPPGSAAAPATIATPSPHPLTDPDPVSPPTAPPPKPAGIPLELQIGMRWTAWVGAVIVVLAVSFFVKLAADQGWFGLIPPTYRCLIAAAFGAVLIAAGEFAGRRVGRWASAGLFGAGLGTLYLTAFATFRYFNLVSETGAFGLLAAVAALGVAITVRGRLLTIGVLSLIGGYIAPVLLPSASAFPAALPLYAGALLTVGLVLSAWQARPFRPLRYVALVAHALLGSSWVFWNAETQSLLALSFMAVSCYLVMAEALLAARRSESSTGNCVATLAVTAWFVLLGNWVLDKTQPGDGDWLGLFTLAVAGLATGLAFCFGAGFRALRQSPQTPIEKLTLTLWAQVGVLLAVAAALQFDGYGQTIGWLALGLAAVELGRRLPSRGVTIYGLLVCMLGCCRVIGADYKSDLLQTVVCSNPHVCITHWSLLALLAIVVVFIVAQRVRIGTSAADTAFARLLHVLTTAGWLGLCALQAEGLAVSTLWLATATVQIALYRIKRANIVFYGGLLVLAMTAARLFIVDRTPEALANVTWSSHGVVLTPWCCLTLFAIALALVAGRIAPLAKSPTRDHVPFFLTLAAATGWLTAWSLQVTDLTITGLWLAAPVALLAAHRWSRRQRYLESALLLLCAAGGRWLIADSILARLAPGYDAAAVTPVLNWQMALALAITATGWWGYRALRRRAWEALASGESERNPLESAWWQLAAITATTFLLVAFSFQVDVGVANLGRIGQTLGCSIDQLRQLLLTLLWTLGALGVGLLGTTTTPRRADGSRNAAALLVAFAWAVLAVCGAKWIVLDCTLVAPTTLQPVLWPLANVQMLAGVLLAGTALLLLRQHRVPAAGDAPAADRSIALARWVPVAAAGVLLWGLSFEVDHALTWVAPRSTGPSMSPWPSGQLRALWTTLLWAAGGVAMLTYGRLRPWRTMFTSGWFLLVASTVAWLTADTLGWRVSAGVAVTWPVLNVQFAVGAALLLLLLAASRLTQRAPLPGNAPDTFATTAIHLAGYLAAAVGLWLGSLEIDRVCAAESTRLMHSAMVRQMGLSMYWGAYGILLVMLGFARPTRWLRWAGLLLLAATLVKVLAVDMSEVQYLYRVLSLLATGLLCLGTSVAYTKLATRLGTVETDRG